MKYNYLTIIGLALVSFAFASCDRRSDTEKAVDEIGDAVEEIADEVGDTARELE